MGNNHVWATVRLGDVCEKIGSGATPRGGEHVYVSEGIALIRSQNIYNDEVLTDGLVYIGEKHAEDLKQVTVQEGDVLLNITGDSVARVNQAPASILPARVNQHVAIIRPDPLVLDKRFLYYFLATPQMQEYMLSLASAGGTRQALTKGIIENFKIPNPPLQEQYAIARILGALDDKIKLNRRMNQTLEGMTTALFKSWFVDFDPVIAKSEGRELHGIDTEIVTVFPSEFQDSELGAIPKGWKVCKINQLTSKIQYGLTQSASVEKVGPKFLRITDIQGGRVNWSDVPYCRVSDHDREKYKLFPGDIVVARTGASTGENLYLSDVPDAVFASYLVRFQFTETATARVIGAFMRTNDYFDYVRYNLGGSAQPNANAQVLSGASLLMSTPEVAKLFAKSVYPFDKRIAQNDKEIILLASMRDALLPKLLSGELRVKQAEKVIQNM